MRARTLVTRHDISSSGKEPFYRVATHRGGVRYIGSGKIVLVGIIRQQAAKRMSKYRLQNTIVFMMFGRF